MAAPDDMTAVVLGIVREAFGPNTKTDAGRVLTEADRRNIVARYAVTDSGETVSTVLVKRAAPERYNLEDLSPGSAAEGLVSDWAGLEFLSNIEAMSGRVPRFYGADRRTGLVVMEDLGDAPSLADVLLGTERDAAHEGLAEIARCMGRMHAATMGQAADYDVIRRRIEGPSSKETEERSSRVLPRVPGVLDEIAVEPQSGFDAELALMIAELNDAGPFHAFIHGDPCPDNWLLGDGGMRLIDFERAAFGHCLRDAIYLQSPFPTCWCIGAIPEDLAARLLIVYRAELRQNCSAADDDRAFERGLAVCTAGYALTRLVLLLPYAEPLDEEWGTSTMRPRLIAWLDRVASLTEKNGQLPATGATAARASARLKGRWPDSTHELPAYPALA